MKKQLIIVGIAAIIVVFSIYKLVVADDNGAIITYTDNNMVYVEGDPEADAKLLVGVSARDSKDGNITDKVIVGKKTVLSAGDQMNVEYVVIDSNNNVTTKDRVVSYVPDDSEKYTFEIPDDNPTGDIDKDAADKTGIPVIKITSAEVSVKVNGVFTPMAYVKETYDAQGDVSGNVVTTTRYNTGEKGDYQVRYYVFDSEGNLSNPSIMTLHVVE